MQAEKLILVSDYDDAQQEAQGDISPAQALHDERLWYGAPARGIAIQLNREGHLSPRAMKVREWKAQDKKTRERDDTGWHAHTVIRLLQAPSLCGWGRHKGSLVLSADGDPVSYGEAIITPGERAAVLADGRAAGDDVEYRRWAMASVRAFSRKRGDAGMARPVPRRRRL